MTQRGSTRVLFGITSCFMVALSFMAYNKLNKVSEKKEETGTSEAKEISAKKGDKKSDKFCNPMFAYNNPNLAASIIEQADQRAKRWMSFRVTGAHRMVGQVGGKSHQPILILDTVVLKPVREDHRGIREVAFYEAIQASSKRSGFDAYCTLFTEEAKDGALPCDKKRVEIERKLLYRLEPYTARYYGTVQYDENSASADEDDSSVEEECKPFGIKPNSYIILNNVTKTFSRPCVLDIKLGTQTFEPDAPEEKRLYELAKYPSQKDFGFRLTAMRIYNPSSADADGDGFIYYPKQYGRSLVTRECVKKALLTFLGGSNLPKDIRANRTTAIQRILTKLKMIKGWFRDNKSFAFYGSSILVIYEGDTVPNDTDGVELDMAKAKMIDFGRVRRHQGPDLGSSKGLSMLIHLFEEILRESFLETSKYIRPARKPESSYTPT